MKYSHCHRCVEEAGLLDFWITLGQALFRSLLGGITGSLGLGVLSLYSLGDALAKGFTLISIRLARRPPTKIFPFGYGKILFISSLVVGLSLFGSGLYMAWTSFADMGSAAVTAPGWVSMVGTILSALSSLVMYRYLSCVARENPNLALSAAAVESRSDLLTSLVVLVGILLSNGILPEADHYAAFLVALAVMWMAIGVMREALWGLLDISVSQTLLSDIARTCRLNTGIVDVDLIRGRHLGEGVELYLHVSVAEALSVQESYTLTEQLKQRIYAEFTQIHHIWVVTTPAESASVEHEDYWSNHLFSFKGAFGGGDTQEQQPPARSTGAPP